MNMSHLCDERPEMISLKLNARTDDECALNVTLHDLDNI